MGQPGVELVEGGDYGRPNHDGLGPVMGKRRYYRNGKEAILAAPPLQAGQAGENPGFVLLARALHGRRNSLAQDPLLAPPIPRRELRQRRHHCRRTTRPAPQSVRGRGRRIEWAWVQVAALVVQMRRP